MYNKDNTKEAEGILSRISTELNQRGKTQAELVSYLDLPRGTYSAWKAGRSRSFCEHIGAIAEFLGVAPGWLVTGWVEKGNVENNREQELLEYYRMLRTEKQEAVLQNIKWLAE